MPLPEVSAPANHINGVQRFYQSSLKSVTRSPDRRFNRKTTHKVFVRFKEKVQIPAGGDGVFARFASEGAVKNVVRQN